MKNIVIPICMLLFYSGAALAQSPLKLWYSHPAATWEECLPLGNGHLGAMPDGGVENENIVLNDITLWSGARQDADRPGASAFLPEIRKLLFAGKNMEAETLINKLFVCKGAGSGNGSGADAPYGCYQVLGNLHLQYDYNTDSSKIKPEVYSRELSLDSSVAKCQYEVGGVTYNREYFASFTDDIIVIRISANHPGKINLLLALDRPERYTTTTRGKELDMAGQLNNGTNGKGMRYLTRVRMKPEGGKLITGKSTLQLTNANAVTIYISSGTDFRNEPFEQKTLGLIEAATGKSYQQQRMAHITAYRKLFTRASLNLNNENTEAAARPTDERLVAFAKDPDDNGLPVLYFQYGRYLLISSTRPGLLPPNLQGLWANTVQTPWNGDYHLDINIQMNHWPLDLTNLPSLNEPFYTLVKGLVKPGEKTAKAYYNGKGWVAHVITNVWGYTSPGESASWGATNSGSGWLCNMLWQHYEFTPDKEYLQKIYPLLKGSAEFYLSTMVSYPGNKWLVTAPSNSPENAFRLQDGNIAHVCIAPTIDNQIIRELFSHVIDAARQLGVDALFRQQLEEARQRLPPNQVGKDGRLMEWLEDYQEAEPHHRHVSPLWGFYPGNEITVSATPKLAEAVKALLIRRGDESTGWSLAWKMNLWARSGDGNHAFSLLRDLLKPMQATTHNTGEEGGTYPNLFDVCPPFQIDGNFGGCAGIAEMLLQSHAGYIELLPAIPDQWKNGNFSGLCVRGGARVNATWVSYKITAASIIASTTHTFKIKIPGYVKKIKLEYANKLTYREPSGDLMNVPLRKGERVDITFL